MKKEKATPKNSPNQSHTYGSSLREQLQRIANDLYLVQEGANNGLESTSTARPIHNPYVRNIGNSRSLRRAVDAMCAHCMGCNEDHMEPGFRGDIRKCNSAHCPLWHFRPFRHGLEDEA